ncbi:sugar transport protein 14-like protein, partial [Tanacetum coccineum]
GVTSMDYFLKEFFPKIYRRKQEHLKETDYCKYDNQILTLFTSSLYFAALVSTFFASHVTRNKGRRASILCGAVSFFAGAFMNAGAQNIAMLIIGRCLLGVGIGFGNQAVPLYLSEMAPAKIRGKVNQLFQLTTCLGIFIANFINNATEKHSWGWRLSLGLAAVPATLMFVGGWFLPETPNSLVEQGRLEEGRRVLEKVRGTKNVEAEFQDLLEASEVAKAIKHPFRNLLERKNRPQLIIGALGIPAFQQLTGMNSVLFYAPVIFQSLGFGSGASLWSSTITSGTLVVATFISMAFADKFGRRALFLEAGVEMIICMVAVAVTLALKFGQGVELPKGIGIFLVIMICIFVLGYGRSWGPLGWLVPSELFPLETRSAGQIKKMEINMTQLCDLDPMLYDAKILARVISIWKSHPKQRPNEVWSLDAVLQDQMSCFVHVKTDDDRQVGEELKDASTDEIPLSDDFDDRPNEYDLMDSFINDGPLENEATQEDSDSDN